MATSASFKQLCPSCEAMVPVRDTSLIGKKIDCPKCKYRFVVEAPDGHEEDDEEPRAKKKGAAKAAKGRSSPIENDDDAGDEGGDEAPKKKKKSNSTVLVGVGVGAVGVVVVMFGFYLFSGSSESKPKNNGAVTTGPGAVGQGTNATTTNSEIKVPDAVVAAPAVNITNLLPNDTRAVVAIQMDKLLASSLNKAALLTRGAFNTEDFEAAFGFPLENVQRIVLGLNGADGVFTVMQTVKAIDRQALEDKLNLVAEPSVNGLEFFTVKGPLDALSNLLIKGQRARDKVQVRFVDSRSMAFADPATMEKFLQAGGKPKFLTQPPAPAASSSTGTGPGTTNPLGGAIGMPPGGVTMPMPPGGVTMPMLPGTNPTAGVAGGNPNDPPKPRETEVSGSFLSVRPDLKTLLDKVDPGGKTTILSIAADPRDPLVGTLIEHLRGKLHLGPSGESLDHQLTLLERPLASQIKTVAIAIEGFNEEKGTATVALDTAQEATAKSLEMLLQVAVDLARPAFRDGLGMDVNPPAGTTGPGARPMGPGGVAPTRPPAGLPMGPGAIPMAGPPGAGPGVPRTGEKTDASASRVGRIGLSVKETTLLVYFDLAYETGPYRKLLRELESYMVEVRGASEMVANRSRVHELAGVIRAYVKDKGQFPRGTVARQAGDMPPPLRQSWLAELLPYLRGDYKDIPRENEKSWQEGDNLAAAQILVPQFLSRKPPYFVRYPGVNPVLASTHFVGIAGIGLDAAIDSAKDPAQAKKLGIFGYDRATEAKEVKDGLDQTIVAIQVPAESASPWLIGGGGTVRGVSEELDAVEPFVCLEHEGKRGTFAIMGDGKVRFLPANLDPNYFRSLCTVAGGDKVAGLDRQCPVVPPPEGEAELKTIAVPKRSATTPEKKVTSP